MNKKNINLVIFIYILTIFLIGVFIRIYFLTNHFTHVDDLIPIRAFNDWSFYKIINKVRILELVPNFVINFTELLHVIPVVSNLIDHIIGAFSVLFSSTYAPVQFFFTSLMVTLGDNYDEILFLGRLPSFVFGVLFIILIDGLVFISSNNKFKKRNVVISTIISSFSIENIVYSAQMESYTIGIFFLTIILILFYLYNNNQLREKQFYFLVFIIFTLSAWSQFQLILFFPGFFIGILYNFYFINREYHFRVFNIFCLGAVIFISLTPLLYLMFSQNLFSSGVNWNAGLNGEFLFTLNSKSLFEFITYCANFFFTNYLLIIENNFTFGISLISNNVVYLVIFIIIIIGFYRIFKINKPLFVYFCINVVIWFVLIVLGKLTFSPTRHSLIIFPIQLLLFVNGLDEINSQLIYTKLNNVFDKFIYLLIIIFNILFVLNIKDLLFERTKKFDETYISNLVKEFSIDYIITYDWTWNFELMDYERIYLSDKGIYKTEFVNDVNNNLLIIGQRNKISYTTLIEIEKLMNIYDINSDLEIIYKYEMSSKIEIEATNYTKNGTNSIYIYIYAY